MDGRYITSGLLAIGLIVSSGLCYGATHSGKSDEAWGVAISSGHGTRYVRPYRFSLSKTYGPIWLEESAWPLHFTWENSIAHWHSDPAPYPGGPSSLNLVTTGPMFRFQKATPIAGLLPYIEGGVGASWLSETEIGGRKLSLHFQFEDKIGVGMRFGPSQALDITFRLHHYSNGSLKTPNSGMNMYLVSLGLWFPAH